MWRISRGPHWIGPYRWEWVCSSSSRGLIMGHAWIRWQAERRLLKAERTLYSEDW